MVETILFLHVGLGKLQAELYLTARLGSASPAACPPAGAASTLSSFSAFLQVSSILATQQTLSVPRLPGPFRVNG